MGEAVLEDGLEFKGNKCSQNAKKDISHFENVEIEIWFDKHYFVREQHGDELGKRLGIEMNFVKDLVIKSIKHLCYYSLKVGNFSFLNFSDTGRFFRILLKDYYSDKLPLNVIAEFHFVSLGKYEVTIKTAMREEDFRVHDGQYIVEIFNEETSTLSKSQMKVIKEICHFTN